MANPIEAISGRLAVIDERTRSPQRDYVGSVLSRTFGIDAAIKTQEIFKGSAHDASSIIARIVAGARGMTSQIMVPSVLDATYNIDVNNIDKNPILNAFRFGVEGVAISVASWGLVMPALVHDPVSFALWKLGDSLAIHVGIDAIEAGLNRIRGFRPPSAVTLAV